MLLSRSLVSFAFRVSLVALVACKGGGNEAGKNSSAPATSATSATGAAAAAAASAPASSAPAAPAAANAKMVDGAKLLPLFPPAGMDGATEKVARPTKEGFAEVAYRKGKDDVAVLTITDTAAVPAVRADYAGATERVEGQPLKNSGYYKSAILVADRFQVQIQSQRLKADQRKAWLAKVDLKGLAALK